MGPIFIELRPDDDNQPETFQVAEIVSIRGKADVAATIFLRGEDTGRGVRESCAEVLALIDAERRRVAMLEAKALKIGCGPVESGTDPVETLRLGNARRDGGRWWGLRELDMKLALECFACEIAARWVGKVVTKRDLAAAAERYLGWSLSDDAVGAYMLELAEKIGPFAEETPDGWKIPMQEKS